MTHKFSLHNLINHRLCVCFLFNQQNSCLSTTHLITRKYLCCQETIEGIFTQTAFVGGHWCTFIFTIKSACIWFDVVERVVWSKDCCPEGLCHLLLNGLAKKKKSLAWKNSSNCLFLLRTVWNCRCIYFFCRFLKCVCIFSWFFSFLSTKSIYFLPSKTTGNEIWL